jgi:serine-type D-ala-D-ala carboxypeptidase
MDTYRGLLGIKTGAEDSGTAFLGASMRGNVTLYTCVLGCDTTQGRFDDTAILMNWAYQNFNRVAIQRTSQVIQIRPSEDNFLLSAVVRPSASTTYMAWPGSDAFTYQTSMLSPNYPVANNQLITTTTWSQGSTNVGTTISQARLTLWTVPAYNLFDLYSVAPYLFGRN